MGRDWLAAKSEANHETALVSSSKKHERITFSVREGLTSNTDIFHVGLTVPPGQMTLLPRRVWWSKMGILFLAGVAQRTQAHPRRYELLCSYWSPHSPQPQRHSSSQLAVRAHPSLSPESSSGSHIQEPSGHLPPIQRSTKWESPLSANSFLNHSSANNPPRWSSSAA